MYRSAVYTILIRVTLVLSLFFLVQTVHAQGSTDGSIYSRFGIGELRSFASSQIQAMGGGGTAALGFNYVNTENPASWSNHVFTRASVGFVYQSLYSTDAQDNTSVLTQGTLNAIQFGFPLLPGKLGVGLAYEPYSRLDYRVQVEGNLFNESIVDTSAYIINYEGDGGLQRVIAGLGYRVNRNLSFGANFDFLFGILERGRRTSFLETGFTQARIVTSTRLTGISGTLGAMLNIPGLLGDEDILSIGTAVSLPVSMSGHRVRTLGEDFDRDTLGTRIDGTVTLPLRTRLGVSYLPDNRWAIIVDGRYEPWSQFESDFEFPGYAFDGENLFKDRFRVSAGFEFLPGGGDPLAPYFQRVGYRLGFLYDQTYVDAASEMDLRTIAATAGLSIPTLFPGTRLDVNMEVGTRGTTESYFVRDTYYRISANVNIGERWFERRRLR